jgi:hypothetical protein
MAHHVAIDVWLPAQPWRCRWRGATTYAGPGQVLCLDGSGGLLLLPAHATQGVAGRGACAYRAEQPSQQCSAACTAATATSNDTS